MQRNGWPEWARTQAECANCGEHGYSDTLVPPAGDIVVYERWLRRMWPDGRAQHTRSGFFIWHTVECESRWKATRPSASPSGWAHQHGILMDKRRVQSGLA